MHFVIIHLLSGQTKRFENIEPLTKSAMTVVPCQRQDLLQAATVTVDKVVRLWIWWLGVIVTSLSVGGG